MLSRDTVAYSSRPASEVSGPNRIRTTSRYWLLPHLYDDAADRYRVYLRMASGCYQAGEDPDALFPPLANGAFTLPVDRFLIHRCQGLADAEVVDATFVQDCPSIRQVLGAQPDGVDGEERNLLTTTDDLGRGW